MNILRPSDVAVDDVQPVFNAIIRLSNDSGMSYHSSGFVMLLMWFSDVSYETPVHCTDDGLVSHLHCTRHRSGCYRKT